MREFTPHISATSGVGTGLNHELQTQSESGTQVLEPSHAASWTMIGISAET